MFTFSRPGSILSNFLLLQKRSQTRFRRTQNLFLLLLSKQKSINFEGHGFLKYGPCSFLLQSQIHPFWKNQLEVCTPECHFPGTGFFPKKSGKFPIPSIREHPLPSPDSVLAFGTGCFPVSFISWIFPEFSRVMRPENQSLVPVPKFGK